MGEQLVCEHLPRRVNTASRGPAECVNVKPHALGSTRELLRTRALAHPSVRALRNLRRFRCIVWAVAKLLILEREARERVNAPGGVGFLQAQASFQFNSSRP